MKHFPFMLVTGALCAGIACDGADAAITGCSVAIEPPGGAGAPPTGGPRTIFRVYANFTSPTDRVNAWGVGADFGPGGIINLNAAGTGLGTGFTNIGGGGGQLAPYSPGTPRDWDTYMTIGVLYGQEAPGGADGTAQIPNTPQFIQGKSWMPDLVNGGGVFITPDMPQGAANYRVSGADSEYSVLLMQLVVNQGEHIMGTIGVAWEPGGPGQGQTVTGLTFYDFSCPGPGSLPLLGVAGLVGARRRGA